MFKMSYLRRSIDISAKFLGTKLLILHYSYVRYGVLIGTLRSERSIVSLMSLMQQGYSLNVYSDPFNS